MQHLGKKKKEKKKAHDLWAKKTDFLASSYVQDIHLKGSSLLV